MSLISIAQRETFHISFVQFDNKDYDADLLTPTLLQNKRVMIGYTFVFCIPDHDSPILFYFLLKNPKNRLF